MDTPAIRTLGHGRASRPPDLASVRLGVHLTRPTAILARSAAAAAMGQVVAAIRGLGIADQDVRTALVSLGPAWDHPADGVPRITGYQAINQVQVRVRDPDLVAAVVDSSVEAGATAVESIDFDVSPALSSEAATEALAAAMADARGRAQVLAAEAGLVLGAVRSIEEWTSGESPRPMFERMALAAVETPILPGTNEIEATVRVTFDLNPQES